MVSIIGPGFGVSGLTAIRSTPHQQHGVALLLGLESDVTIRRSRGSEVRGRAVVVAADVAHAVESPGPAVGMLFDPDELPRIEAYAHAGGTRSLHDRPARRLLQAAISCRSTLGHHDVLEGLGRELIGMLGDAPVRRRDPRVGRVLRLLREPDVERERVLGAARVSEAHLQALFVRDVGVTMRKYRLWQRLLAAVLDLRRADATGAAHAAGFADLAHFRGPVAGCSGTHRPRCAQGSPPRRSGRSERAPWLRRSRRARAPRAGLCRSARRAA